MSYDTWLIHFLHVHPAFSLQRLSDPVNPIFCGSRLCHLLIFVVKRRCTAVTYIRFRFIRYQPNKITLSSQQLPCALHYKYDTLSITMTTFYGGWYHPCREIKYVCETLYPYTQVNAATKLQHIDDIMHTKQDSRQTASQKQATPNAQSGTDISNVPHVKAVDKDESRGKAAAQDMPHSKATSQEERTDFAKERQKHNDLQICPKCGANLILRTAAKGAHTGEQFYGCSRFPKCRYRRSASAK